MSAYAEKLRDPRWQKKRLQVFERDNWACVLCGDKGRTLNVHHLEYMGDPWNAPLDKLKTLCQHCHAAVELLEIRNWGAGESIEIGKVKKVVSPIRDDVYMLFFYFKVNGNSFFYIIQGTDGKLELNFICGDPQISALRDFLSSI